MMHETDRGIFLMRKAESERREIWKILKSKKILTKVSGITVPTWEPYFQGLFKAASEISDEQTMGNHDYPFSNWNYSGHLNDPITLEELPVEALKIKTGKTAGPCGNEHLH